MKGNISNVTVTPVKYQSLAQDGLKALTRSVDSLHEASIIFMQIPDKEWMEELKHFPRKLKTLADKCRQYGLLGIDTRLLSMSNQFAVRARALTDADKKRVMEQGVECSLYKSKDSAVRVGTAMIMPDEMTTEQMDLCIAPKGKSNFAKIRPPAQQDKEKRRLLKLTKEQETQKESRVIERKQYTMSNQGVKLKVKTDDISFGLLASLIDDFNLIRKK